MIQICWMQNILLRDYIDVRRQAWHEIGFNGNELVSGTDTRRAHDIVA